MNLMFYVFLCLLSIHVYAYYVVIYLLFMDDACKKEKLSFVLNWHSHAFIDIQNLMHKFRGAFYFDELSSFYSKSETLFMMSSIIKKGEIESASSPLTSFGD
jgi:hypothetical protein